MVTITCKTRRWGNSIGVVLPKKELEELRIGSDETVCIEIRRKDNPLKELFGAGKDNPITCEEFERYRKESRVSKYW
jgi:hypothetical protein